MKTLSKISLVTCLLAVVLSSCGMVRNCSESAEEKCSDDRTAELNFQNKNVEDGSTNEKWIPAAERGVVYASPVKLSEGVVPHTATNKKRTNNKLVPAKTKSKENSKFKRKEQSKNALSIIKEQKKNNKGSGWSSADVLLVILCIFLPWLAVGIYTGWDVKLTLITLLLWILGWVPGVIFGMLVLFDVVG